MLEVYALLLAWMQATGGVRTDEAKYLLNIPYPHPPLVRFVMSLTEGFATQEMLWRILLATLLVQAVWIVVKMSNNWILPALYLLSVSVVLQAGTIMMAPITAVQGLVFVWLLMESEKMNNETMNKHQNTVEHCSLFIVHSGMFALLWLASLFTAYQAVLYAPIVAVIFWRMKTSRTKKLIGFAVPIGLMALYILTNPLAMASFVNAGGQNTSLELLLILKQIGHAWLLAGSVLLSILGTVGMVRARNMPLILSMVLVVAFLFVSYRSYYPILFLPLFVGGTVLAPDVLKKSLVVAQAIALLTFMSSASFIHKPSEARQQVPQMDTSEGYIEIDGSFGHEWQYESTLPVLRYRNIEP